MHSQHQEMWRGCGERPVIERSKELEANISNLEKPLQFRRVIHFPPQSKKRSIHPMEPQPSKTLMHRPSVFIDEVNGLMWAELGCWTNI